MPDKHGFYTIDDMKLTNIVIIGDFNEVNLPTALPKFYQDVNFPTRDANTLDHVYLNINDAYKASSSPHMGQSGNISLNITPVYKQSDHSSGPGRYGPRMLSPSSKTVSNAQVGIYSNKQ